jgi:prepilin-type N-terminal cleavage/methylation domain-containing protein
MRRRPSPVRNGFTLIEIVIVLAIFGLLLGGVLKGQEMITTARVRNLISDLDAVRAAYLGFRDRYRALPGDYGYASASIAGVSPLADGNNNGVITASGLAGATIDEHIAAWDHLSKAGFINANYAYAPAPETMTSAPTNPYSRFLQLVYDNAYGNGASSAAHNVKTGNQIPSGMLAEVDRKIDDGLATSGAFRFSTYSGGGTGGTAPAGAGACYAASGNALWSSTSPVDNCGGASLL